MHRTLLIVSSSILHHDHGTSGNDIALKLVMPQQQQPPPAPAAGADPETTPLGHFDFGLPYPLRSSVLEHVVTFVRCCGDIVNRPSISVVLGDNFSETHRENAIVNGWGQAFQGSEYLVRRLSQGVGPSFLRKRRRNSPFVENRVLVSEYAKYKRSTRSSRTTTSSSSAPAAPGVAAFAAGDYYDEEDPMERVQAVRGRVNLVAQEFGRRQTGLFGKDSEMDGAVSKLADELVGGAAAAAATESKPKAKTEEEGGVSDYELQFAAAELFWAMALTHLVRPDDMESERPQKSRRGDRGRKKSKRSRASSKHVKKLRSLDVIYVSLLSDGAASPIFPPSLRMPNDYARVKLIHVLVTPPVQHLVVLPSVMEQVIFPQFSLSRVEIPMNVLCTMSYLSEVLLLHSCADRPASGIGEFRLRLQIAGLSVDQPLSLPMICVGVPIDITHSSAVGTTRDFADSTFPTLRFMALRDDHHANRVSQQQHENLANHFHTKSMHVVTPVRGLCHPLTRTLIERLTNRERRNRVVLLRYCEDGTAPTSESLPPTHFLMVHHNRIYLHVIEPSKSFLPALYVPRKKVFDPSGRLREGDFDKFLFEDLSVRANKGRRSELRLLEVALDDACEAPMIGAKPPAPPAQLDPLLRRIEGRRRMKTFLPPFYCTTASFERKTRLFPLCAADPGGALGLRRFPRLTRTVIDPIVSVLLKSGRISQEEHRMIRRVLHPLCEQAKINAPTLIPELQDSPTERFEVLRKSWYELRMLALIHQRREVVMDMDSIWPTFVYVGDRKLESILGKKPLRVRRNQDGSPVLPIAIGSALSIDCLGTVCNRKNYFTEKYIWPVGFQSTRIYFDVRNVEMKVKYVCTIEEGSSGPRFAINSEALQKPIVEGTATAAWTVIVKTVNEIKTDRAKRRVFTNVSGPDYYGLAHPQIIQLVAELPGAETCLPRPNAPFRMARVTQENDLARFLGKAVDAARVPPSRSQEPSQSLPWTKGMSLSSYVSARENQLICPVEFAGREEGEGGSPPLYEEEIHVIDPKEAEFPSSSSQKKKGRDRSGGMNPSASPTSPPRARARSAVSYARPAPLDVRIEVSRRRVYRKRLRSARKKKKKKTTRKRTPQRQRKPQSVRRSKKSQSQSQSSSKKRRRNGTPVEGQPGQPAAAAASTSSSTPAETPPSADEPPTKRQKLE